VRRFNASIRKVYKRTPTQIRRLSRLAGLQPENQYLFRLRYRPPYNWAGMLRFLAARATPGVESVEDGHYRRSISLNGSDGYVDLSLNEDDDGLVARVQFGDPRSLFLIVERLRAMFDLNADWAAIAPSLKSDPALAQRVDAQPGLRVPGAWNGFELAVRAILGQQITVKGATTLAGTLARTFGRTLPSPTGLAYLFPRPEDLAEADLTAIGLTKARAATIRGLARAVCEGKVSFEGIVAPEDFLSRLCEIPGIGTWTAQYIAMRALGEPDAFPSGDIGLLRALGLKSSAELERRSEAWRPWRAYATMYLWSLPAESVAAVAPAARKDVPARTGTAVQQRIPLGV
jgi:AraC family transcriptional regulator of adaptative response / DNA-3-methyladenine glycosylase II